ncbi:MAG: DUF1634 domain-containing protein [Thermodesulfobacteriota bacterium]
MTTEITKEATVEQLLYASILEKGMYFGLLSMIITFALYVSGIMPSVVPLSEIANYWNMPVGDYLTAINQNFLQWEHAPTGWAWLSLLGKGDFLNFLPIAVLSGVTILCYVAIVPGLFKRGDKAMGLMALATAIVLFLAASGIMGGGAH